MSVICVGTMAFDAIETPFGKVDQIVGGSGTYVAYAASNFVKPIQQISIVGYDFPQEEMDELTKRGHQIDLLEPFSFTVGQGEAVVRETTRNVNFAGSDPRSDGEAIPQEPATK